MALSRAQSVSPRGRGAPDFTVTRIVPVLLMSRGLSGRYDSAGVFVTLRHDHEKYVVASPADDLDALLAIFESRIGFFQTVLVFEGKDGIRKAHAVLAKVLDGFANVPFVSHTHSTGYR